MPSCVFNAELGHTPANNAALLEYEAWIDKVIAIGDADDEDKITCLAKLKEGLEEGEDERLRQDAEKDEKLKEQAVRNAECVSKLAFKRTTEGPCYRAAPVSHSIDSLSSISKAKRDEAAVERLRLAKTKADPKSQ